MSYDFPASPTEDQEFTPSGGPTYVYKAPVWTAKPVASGGGGGPADWDDITDKPATFPPTVPIAWTDVSGKPVTYPPTVPIAWSNINGQPATYPPTLPIAQSGVTNLTTDLAAKEPALPAGGTASNFLRGDKTWAVPAGGGGGSGDVVGPASATDTALARFSGTTGKLVKDSTLFMADNGTFTLKSGANTILSYQNTAPASSTGGLVLTAMPPHGQQFYVFPRSDIDGSTHMSGWITFDGPVTLPAANPTAAREAAHKKYVDDTVAAIPAAPDEVVGGKITIASTAPSSPAVNDVWIDTT